MADPQIRDGRLNAPYFIYFRRTPPLTDEQILAHFGLLTHRRTDQLPGFSTYAVIADLCDWTLLADDWHYHLWHTPATRAAIERLAEQRDVFAWSVGDCDESFAYCVYRGGQLIRQYVVDSPHFSDQVVRIDFGHYLPFEAEILASGLPIEQKMHRFTIELGISPLVMRDMLRVYSMPFQSKLDPNAGIRNF